MELKDGDVLVREGTSDDHLFVVISGALGVVRHPQGEPPVTLHTLVAGDFAGELSFIDGTERYASLQAVGPTRVMSLRRPQLESLLKSDPEIVYRAMRAIVRTAHAIQRRLSSPVGRTGELHLQAARPLLRRPVLERLLIRGRCP